MKEILVKKVMENGVKKETANKIIKDIFDTILLEVDEKGKFGILNFGTFKKKEIKAKTILAFGKENVNIPSQTKVVFVPSKKIIKYEK